jgi:hypothetical protein
MREAKSLTAIAILSVLAAFCLCGCGGIPIANTRIAPAVKGDAILAKRVVLLGETSAANFLADALSTDLLGLGFHIVERSRLVTVLHEHNLSLTRLTEKGDYVRLGKLTDIDAVFLVSGILSEYGDISAANVQLVDLKTGELIMSTTFSQPAGDKPANAGHDSLTTNVRIIAGSIRDAVRGSAEEAKVGR